jgi:hypothetical protein
MIELPITKVDKLLELDESILSVAVVNMKGQIVCYKSKYQIPNKFISNKNHTGTDFGIWIRGAYAMFEQCAKNFGKVQTFVSLYEDVNLLVLPMNEINSLLVLTVLPSASIEYITAKISLLMSNCSPAKEIDDDYKKNRMASDNKWLV